jgi:recombination associated protein RdgC
MTWNDKISFVLDDELCIKRLRYLDEFTEQRQESDDEASIFYADFILLSNSLAMLVDAVIDVMKTEEQAQ